MEASGAEAATIRRNLSALMDMLGGKGTPEEAAAHFGWMAMFAGLDMPASSAKTQAELGWKPKEIGVIEDIGRPEYFPA